MPAPEWHTEDHELHVCRKDVGVVLYGKMTDTEADDPATCTGLAVLVSTVNSDTSENGSNSVRGEVFRDWGDVADIGNDIFGEGTIDGVAAELALSAVCNKCHGELVAEIIMGRGYAL